MVYKWRICPVDTGVRVDPNPDCPNADHHTLHPVGYIADAEWADDMAVTHDQSQCPGCDLWVIWTPKAATDAAA